MTIRARYPIIANQILDDSSLVFIHVEQEKINSVSKSKAEQGRARPGRYIPARGPASGEGKQVLHVDRAAITDIRETAALSALVARRSA